MPPGLKKCIESIAANVRHRRQVLRLTQDQLAERAEIDMKYLQRIEAGSRASSLAALCRLADALGSTPSALLRPAQLKRARRGRPEKL